MCKHGIKATLVRLSEPRSDGSSDASVDPCIAPLVAALNDAGIPTAASCCGHGHRPGTIALADGRELLIMPSFDAARALDGLWPDIHGV